MAVQKVVTYGHRALREMCTDITDFSNVDSLINDLFDTMYEFCLLYTSPSPRDRTRSRMPSSA